MGVVAQDLGLQVVAEAAHDRDGHAEREGAEADAQEREERDRGEEAALARAELPHGDEHLGGQRLEAVEEPGEPDLRREEVRLEHRDDGAEAEQDHRRRGRRVEARPHELERVAHLDDGEDEQQSDVQDEQGDARSAVESA
ncbi:MAG: hypothetical protein R3A48_06900 [Polyangiales bacterium]